MLSDRPRYCETACRPYHDKIGKPTPCLGCEFARPEAGADNAFFEGLYMLVFGCRDGYGGLRWDVYFRLLDQEGLSLRQKRLHLRKALRVERLVAHKQALDAKERMEKAGKKSRG